ncbi:aldo/keto reductase family oxidoreductase, partial [Curtobacterium sp. CT11-133]
WSPRKTPAKKPSWNGDRAHYAELNDVLVELAAAHGVTPTGIAVAWITRHPAAESRTRCGFVVLSREEWYRVFTAAGHTVPRAD